MVNKPNKGSENGERELIDGAVSAGVDAILKRHPMFKNNQEYISKHIDKDRLQQGVARIYGYIQEQEERGKEFNPQEKAKFVYENLANYVASGGAFDDNAREVVLKGSLEERAQGRGRHARRARAELEGEREFEHVINAFQDVYSMLKTGDYAQRMPELAQAVTTINDMGFMNSAVDVLHQYGLIDNRRYDMLKKNIKQKAGEATKQAYEGMAKYSTTQKVTASILGVLGLGSLIATSTGITGKVISDYNLSADSSLLGIAIGVLLIAGSMIILRSKKVKR